MVKSPPSKPGASVADERGQRLLTALEELLSQGDIVFSPEELAQQAQVTKSMAKVAIANWLEHGWIEKENFHAYIIREKTPFAPSNGALDAIGLLKIISAAAYRLDRLTYGYASALHFHELSELVAESIFIFQAAPAISPPKVPENLPFRRSNKRPKEWGEWRNKKVYVSRRHPSMIRPYQRMHVDYRGVKVPCTTPAKTLLDCWIRPDLAGGSDRVSDAWNAYLSRNQDHGTIGNELSAILKDSGWASLVAAFNNWIRLEHPTVKMR